MRIEDSQSHSHDCNKRITDAHFKSTPESHHPCKLYLSDQRKCKVLYFAKGHELWLQLDKVRQEVKSQVTIDKSDCLPKDEYPRLPSVKGLPRWLVPCDHLLVFGGVFPTFWTLQFQPIPRNVENRLAAHPSRIQ